MNDGTQEMNNGYLVSSHCRLNSACVMFNTKDALLFAGASMSFIAFLPFPLAIEGTCSPTGVGLGLDERGGLVCIWLMSIDRNGRRAREGGNEERRGSALGRLNVGECGESGEGANVIEDDGEDEKYSSMVTVPTRRNSKFSVLQRVYSR